MFNQKEIGIIVLISIILAFAINLLQDLNTFLYILLGIFVIIFLNAIAKKITAHYLESDIEIKLWEFSRYGFSPQKKFKNAFPAGAIIPLISRIIFFPFNGFIWMGSLIFDTKAKTYRVAKRNSMYSFSEMTEDHIGYIAAAGIAINLIFVILFYLVGLKTFAKISIWYALFNMIPISNLDGNKIFFGNPTLWTFLATLTLIAFGYSILLI